jgi:hypothetical protein
VSSDITRRAALCGLAGASFAACGQLSAASAPGIPETTGYANVPGGRVWWLRVRIQAGLMRHLGFYRSRPRQNAGRLCGESGHEVETEIKLTDSIVNSAGSGPNVNGRQILRTDI